MDFVFPWSKERIRFICIRFHLEQTWSLILKLSTRWTHYNEPIKNSTEISVFICIRMRQSTTNLSLSRIDGMHRSEATDGKKWKWIRFSSPLRYGVCYLHGSEICLRGVYFRFPLSFFLFFLLLLLLLLVCLLRFFTDPFFMFLPHDLFIIRTITIHCWHFTSLLIGIFFSLVETFLSKTNLPFTDFVYFLQFINQYAFRLPLSSSLISSEK